MNINIQNFIKKPDISQTYNNIKILVYGESGTGKSHFWNTFPKGILCYSTDNQYNHLKDQNFIVFDLSRNTTKSEKGEEINSWEFFKASIELAKNSDNVKTIVIDLVSDLYERARTFVLSKLKINHESDLGFGKGWQAVRREFFSVMQELVTMSGKNIVLVCHEKTTDENGTQKARPNLEIKVFDKINGWVPIVGWTRRMKTNSRKSSFVIETNSSQYNLGKNKYDIDQMIDNNYIALQTAIKNKMNKKAEKQNV